jgi:hypothetical protein
VSRLFERVPGYFLHSARSGVLSSCRLKETEIIQALKLINQFNYFSPKSIKLL